MIETAEEEKQKQNKQYVTRTTTNLNRYKGWRRQRIEKMTADMKSFQKTLKWYERWDNNDKKKVICSMCMESFTSGKKLKDHKWESHSL